MPIENHVKNTGLGNLPTSTTAGSPSAAKILTPEEAVINTSINGKTTPRKSLKKAIVDRVPQSRLASNKVGLSNLPVQKEMWCKRKGGHLTMILAGCRGTGKTTFLNTLIGEDMEGELPACEPMQVRDRKYHLQEDKFDMDLTVVDMPDFGANIDNQNTWLPLVKYIEYQYRSYLIQEEQPFRSQMRDNRVHVCVYFINPTNTDLSSLDIESMKEISKRVSLIPVIARSDTLNKDELYNFKSIITKTLKENEIEVCKYVTDSFATEKINAHSPYAIIGSNVVYTNPDGKSVRARKYGWGMVEVENAEHCDFIHIRDLLMSEHLLDLISATETHYTSFRQRFLKQRLSSTKAALNNEHPSQNTITGEEDGIASYVMYKKTLNLDDMVMLEKYNGEEEQLQQEARVHLDDIIRKQEAKFRELKASIYTKQKIYNNDLDDAHLSVKQLETEIEKLSPDDKDIIKDIAQKAGLPAGIPQPAPQSDDSTLATGFTIMF
ncbi:hypothetical protein OXX79_003368 [Metschnikowia pulcherrima]